MQDLSQSGQLAGGWGVRWRGLLRVLTLAQAGAGPGGGTAEAAGGRPVADHILLRLEEDDVQLGCEEAAEHHRTTEAD